MPEQLYILDFPSDPVAQIWHVMLSECKFHFSGRKLHKHASENPAIKPIVLVWASLWEKMNELIQDTCDRERGNIIQLTLGI